MNLHQIHNTQLDVFDWYAKYQSCVRYFHDQAQYTDAVQAVAAMVNILLPFQRRSRTPGHAIAGSGPCVANNQNIPAGADASLVPYVRRLVATGFDSPEVLFGFFGSDWSSGIGHIHENERKNYLFAAKSETWLKVRASYDLGEDEAIPFLKPLQGVTEKEIQAAEASWSEWLAMQDWMLGPRAPESGAHALRGDR
ncbi:hypothetical protein ESCO_002548 [Escovopsis weberi]|uniref:Ilp is an apoptosis inhibitor n=1 Tax=Escovopsis weberi TaxID=150374 RepID=A0A0M8MW27_ESCWE|nr:hypothetical protein ESCO_002548 [Escovopsis weberi]